MSKIMIAVVIGALSGDSLSVRMNNDIFRVKIEGIKAPARGEKYSIDAEQMLFGLCFQKTATIYYDEPQKKSLILGSVKCGNIDVANELVRKGLANVASDNPNIKLADSLAFAKSRRYGIWALRYAPKDYVSPSAGAPNHHRGF